MSRSLTEQTDILADETVLYGSWTPEVLPEHEMEFDDNDLHDAPAPVVRGASPHNAFIYEKTGQRKTVGVTHKLDDLRVFAGNNDIDVCIVRYSSTKDNLSYQIIANLVAELSGEKPRGYDKKTVFDVLYENPSTRWKHNYCPCISFAPTSKVVSLSFRYLIIIPTADATG